jgi:hypothetical protein
MEAAQPPTQGARQQAHPQAKSVVAAAVVSICYLKLLMLNLHVLYPDQ